MLGRWIWARVEPHAGPDSRRALAAPRPLAGPALAVDLPGRGTRPADVSRLVAASGSVPDSPRVGLPLWLVPVRSEWPRSAS
jgi:hypothetical protein